MQEITRKGAGVNMMNVNDEDTEERWKKNGGRRFDEMKTKHGGEKTEESCIGMELNTC